MRHLLSLLAALALASPALAGSKSLGADARAILQKHCAECHGGGKAAKGRFGFVLDRDLLIARSLITPGQANQSDLFLRVQQGEMPPKSSTTRPSAAELKTLQAWIDAGAPPFEPTAKTSRALTPPETIDAILTDLERLDPRRRRFTRYLTLSHLAGRSAKDLDVTREATGKLLNSLSWHPRLTRPEAVDADATILRVDLRAYKWNASLWEKLVAVYPYRLQSTADTRALKTHTDSEAPALRADWFVANASRPPLYHDLLQLPVGDKALERLLQVDVATDVQEDNISRAGFNDSGVSKNNRLLERHDSAYGVFWRSYDFAANTGRQNLFEHPLGPNTGAVSFQPAGGEMIFHLPNGLQAYMLVDAKGKRIDKGPIEIVADPRRPDQRVETGVSCMSCHARGLLFKPDQLRGHVEKNAQVFGKAVVDTIRATHPRPAKFKAQIEEDNTRYLKALEKFGVRDPDQEPVNLITLRFEATMDGATAAAELGLTYDNFVAFLKSNPEQTRILGSLLVKGATVQRTTFQEHFPALAERVIAHQALAIIKNKPRPFPAFEGHAGTVNAIAFAHDGKRAASASDDRTIRVWAIPSGQLLASLESGNAEVYGVAFSRDGKYLLSGGRDRVVRLWDLDKRAVVRVFKGHTDAIRAVAFSPNGKWAVSGGDDRSLRVWNVTVGEEKSTLDGHSGPITALAWSSDGKQILSGSRDGTARWWDWTKSNPLAILEGHAGPVLCVALSADGKSALTGGNDRTVRHWNLAKAKEWHAFTGHANAVVRVQFHAGDREILSSSSQHQGAENTWRRWDLSARKQLGATSAGADNRFGCAAFSPDGHHVLVGGPGGFLKLFQAP